LDRKAGELGWPAAREAEGALLPTVKLGRGRRAQGGKRPTPLDEASLARELDKAEALGLEPEDGVQVWREAWRRISGGGRAAPGAPKKADERVPLPGARARVLMAALEAVAARHAWNLDAEGAFQVGAEDEVAVELEGRVLQVPVRQLLELSGLAQRVGDARYRFHPLWLHLHLAERSLEGPSG
jgi:hypothetical protein